MKSCRYVCSFALMACATTSIERGVLMAQTPCEVSGGLNELTLLCPWHATNQSTEALVVKGVTWAAKVHDGPDLSGQDAGRVLAPHETADGTVRIVIPIASRQGGMQAVPYEVQAEIAVDKEPQKVSWRGEFLWPVNPRVTITAQAGRAADMLELSYTVGLHNDNAFAVKVKKLDYAFVVGKDKDEISTQTVAHGQRVLGGTVLQFDVHRALLRTESPELFIRLAGATTIPYQLHYALELDTQRFVGTLDGELTFSR